MSLQEQRFESCSSLDALGQAMGEYSRSLGLAYFSYLLVGAEAPEDDVLLTNYADNWRERYMRKCYQHYDPVIVTSRGARLPFVWNQKSFLQPFRKTQKRVFYEAREYRITAGYSVPVRGPVGDLGVFSIVASREADLLDALRAEGSDILMAAMQAHDRAVMLSANAPAEEIQPPLTPRELECLKWTAEGHTSNEIADILALSGATVNYHLNKAVSKLCAANRHHAAIIAIRRKLM